MGQLLEEYCIPGWYHVSLFFHVSNGCMLMSVNLRGSQRALAGWTVACGSWKGTVVESLYSFSSLGQHQQRLWGSSMARTGGSMGGIDD